MHGSFIRQSTRPSRSATVDIPTAEYKPRKPDEKVLHRVLRDHLEDFLQEARERSREGEGSYLSRKFGFLLTHLTIQ
jgi:hypothetical protein